MNNINLYQTTDEGSGRRNKLTLLDSGFFWSLSILFITLVMFGGSKLVSVSLKNKNQALEKEIAEEAASFAGSDLDRIVDFQVRVDEANKNIATKLDTDKIFSAVESSMVKGGSAVSFAYVKNPKGVPVIDMEMIASDFPLIAKQILSFKENRSFAGVFVKNITRSENGINFSIVADFK